MTEAKVSLREGYKTIMSVGGHTVITDEPLDVAGGQDLGPTPLGLMVGSLGSCIAVTVKLYADRKKWPLDGVDVDVTMKRFKAAEYAAYDGDEDFVHEFKVRVDLKGNLTDEQRVRLMEIAGKCPVHRALVMPAFVFDEMVEPTSV